MKKKLIPTFAHGTLEQIERAIAQGKLEYPSYCWIDDTDQYAFLNKYGELERGGIPKITGTLENEIVLSNLPDGVYQVKGQHRVSTYDPTVFLSASYVICIVMTIDGFKKVKRITADEVTDYVVEDDVVTSRDSIVTESYLRENGYANTAYVDAKIAALKVEIEHDIEPLVEPVVEKYIDENIQGIGEEKIEALFE